MFALSLLTQAKVKAPVSRITPSRLACFDQSSPIHRWAEPTDTNDIHHHQLTELAGGVCV